MKSSISYLMAGMGAALFADNGAQALGLVFIIVSFFIFFELRDK